MSRVKVNEITNKVATGPVDFPDGITGVALTVTGNVTVGGTIISEDTTNVDSVGWVTARSGLTVGPPSTGIGATIHSNGNAVFAGIVTTGNLTAGSGTFSGAVNIDDTTASTSTSTGALIVDGGVGIAKSLNVAGRVNLGGKVQFTVASPQLEFNNGGPRLWSPSANTLTIHTGGGFDSASSERLRIGSSGEIGIGGANYGTSGQVLTSAGSGAAVAWGDVSAGMSEYDVWTIDYETSTGVFDNNIIGQTTGEGSPVTVNLSRVTTSQNARFAKVGTGMTVSSGTWTFPSTGYWEVIFTPNGYSTGAAQKTWKVKTTDNNSTYTDAYWTYGYGGIYTQESEVQHSYFNITDVSNQKIQFILLSGGVNYSFYGSSSKVVTNWVFKKVA